MRTSRWQLWLGLLVSAVMLAGVVRWALGQEPPRLPGSRTGYLVLSATLLGYLGNMAVRGLRWHVILRITPLTQRLRDSVGLTFLGYGANAVLPARGGDLVRAALLRRRVGTSWRRAVGSIVAERFADLAVLVALLAALTAGGVAGRPLGTATPVFALGTAVLAAVVLRVAPGLLRLTRLGRVLRPVAPLLEATRRLRGTPGTAVVALTALIWLGDSLALLGCARALDIDVGVAEALLVVTVASLSGVIPAGPGNVGTFDAALLLALHASDVSGADALSLVVLVRLVFFAPVIGIAALLMATEYGWSSPFAREERALEPSRTTPT